MYYINALLRIGFTVIESITEEIGQAPIESSDTFNSNLFFSFNLISEANL